MHDTEFANVEDFAARFSRYVAREFNIVCQNNRESCQAALEFEFCFQIEQSIARVNLTFLKHINYCSAIRRVMITSSNLKVP